MTLPCGCPESFPDWDDQDINLGGHLVHEQTAPMFLHMPIAFDLYRQRQMDDIATLELHETWPGLALTRSASFRGSIVRLLDDETCPARRVHRLPNPFRLRVALHHGDIGGMRPLLRNMQSRLISSGRKPLEVYLAYLTCPLCAEQRGGNKIMLLRHWTPSEKISKGLKKLKAKEAMKNGSRKAARNAKKTTTQR